jgi:predicted nucleic acid-binding protein
MAVVIDASVAMGWFLQSQASDLADAVEERIADDDGWVPGHFGVEIGRALRRRERAGELTADFVDEAFQRLQTYPLKQDLSDRFKNLDIAVKLARTHRLRVADACYLELALRLKLPLATRDAALARAAERSGATLFRP